MTPPDNEQTTDNQSTDSEHEKTVILMRCEKHDLTYMANEGCPECEKEKSSAGG
jgi:hypothetical protein